MGIVSIGRRLIVRQLFFAGLVVAVGTYATLALDNIQAMVLADPKAGSDAVMAAIQAATSHILIATLVAAVALVVSLPMAYAAVGRPLKTLTRSVEALANGERASEIDGQGRTDEIGVMARSLHQIRGALIVLEDHHTTAAMSSRVTSPAMLAASQKVVGFSSEIAAQVRRLGSMTKRLSETSDMMIVAAKHASDGSDQATTASSNAAGDVSSVATASEQLLDSIEEISRQVVQSTNVVKTAVERAVDTNAGMARLSAAAQKVGDVVSLISRIAAQTNLLALNATIEAARAGEAGRGFAVVAQEVKTLATQTAKATQDITGQIAEMQEATEVSVLAIDKIQKKISEVEHISTIIAAAVHEQGAATQEIARNVRSAAAGTATMSGHMENIVRSVDETSSNAVAVSGLAREFDDIVGTMNDVVRRVDDFAKSVAA